MASGRGAGWMGAGGAAQGFKAGMATGNPYLAAGGAVLGGVTGALAGSRIGGGISKQEEAMDNIRLQQWLAAQNYANQQDQIRRYAQGQFAGQQRQELANYGTLVGGQQTGAQGVADFQNRMALAGNETQRQAQGIGVPGQGPLAEAYAARAQQRFTSAQVPQSQQYALGRQGVDRQEVFRQNALAEASRQMMLNRLMQEIAARRAAVDRAYAEQVGLGEQAEISAAHEGRKDMALGQYLYGGGMLGLNLLGQGLGSMGGGGMPGMVNSPRGLEYAQPAGPTMG